MTAASTATEETAARFRHAGIVPPDDRAGGTYANALRLLAMLHWLRQPLRMADEPAHVFSPLIEG